MSLITVYLVKSCGCAAILLLYYYIVLRNRKIHFFNRFYLIGSMLLSMVVPLLHLQWLTANAGEQRLPSIDSMLQVINGAGEPESGIHANPGGFSIALILYVTAVLVSISMLLRLTVSIVRVLRLKTRYPVTAKPGFNFIETDLPEAPFSFFNNLFWRNDIDINGAAGERILAHELTHIEQKHTLDRIFAEAVTAIFWINPFFYIIKKELCAIHEFLADEKAVGDNNPHHFAIMLLHTIPQAGNMIPVHSFYHSSIKRRLLMLTANNKTNASFIRRIMVAPLLACTLLIFAFRLQNNSTGSTTAVQEPFTLIVDAGHGGNDYGAAGINNTNEKDITLAIARQLQQKAAAYGIHVLMTREADITATPSQRVSWIKTQQADACISIHVNSTGSAAQTDSSGFDIYIARDDTNGKLANSKLLGSAVLNSLQEDFKKPAGLSQQEAGIWILQANPLPAILVECGYINNATDYRLLTGKADIIAKKILQGVAAYAKSVTP